MGLTLLCCFCCEFSSEKQLLQCLDKDQTTPCRCLLFQPETWLMTSGNLQQPGRLGRGDPFVGWTGFNIYFEWICLQVPEWKPFCRGSAYIPTVNVRGEQPSVLPVLTAKLHVINVFWYIQFIKTHEFYCLIFNTPYLWQSG